MTTDLGAARTTLMYSVHRIRDLVSNPVVVLDSDRPLTYLWSEFSQAPDGATCMAALVELRDRLGLIVSAANRARDVLFLIEGEKLRIAEDAACDPVPRAEGDTHNVDLCKFMDRMTLVRRAGKAVSDEEKVR